jgi:hypothetical protein
MTMIWKRLHCLVNAIPFTSLSMKDYNRYMPIQLLFVTRIEIFQVDQIFIEMRIPLSKWKY